MIWMLKILIVLFRRSNNDYKWDILQMFLFALCCFVSRICFFCFDKLSVCFGLLSFFVVVFVVAFFIFLNLWVIDVWCFFVIVCFCRVVLVIWWVVNGWIVLSVFFFAFCVCFVLVIFVFFYQYGTVGHIPSPKVSKSCSSSNNNTNYWSISGSFACFLHQKSLVQNKGAGYGVTHLKTSSNCCDKPQLAGTQSQFFFNCVLFCLFVFANRMLLGAI